ncbi:SH3 domain-containing protein 21 isoform X1 [Ambystoma mexicanum]|uniref:SH3 domain-containing protein 21 isoform X1 n=1 Tax=Ambystoma mexicanum TaxID=8296 RepID=UPI0037E90EAD
MEVLVLNDFLGTLDDELDIKTGDVVKNVKKHAEDGWMEGDLNGRRGIFPLQFVKEIPASLMGDGNKKYPRSIRKVKAKSPQRWCKVEFSYMPENQDELELTAGETVEIIQEIEDGWWLGKKGGRVGAFPSNFVQECTSPPTGMVLEVAKNNKLRQRLNENTFLPNGQDKSTNKTPGQKNNNKAATKEHCKVMFDYLAANNDELSMKAGDVIQVLRKETEDDGWWEGELNGKTGLFPDNFVMLLPTPVAQGSLEKYPTRKSTVKAPAKPLLTVPEKKPADIMKPQTQVPKDLKVKSDFTAPEKKPADGTKSPTQALKDQKVKSDFTAPEKKPADVTKSPTQAHKDQKVKSDLTASEKKPSDVTKSPTQVLKDQKADMLTEKKAAEASRAQTPALNTQKETKDFKMDSVNKATQPPTKKLAPPPPTALKNKPSLKTPDRPDGNVPAKPVELVKANTMDTDASQFDALAVSSAKLSHPTSDRPKMPGKRPPTNLNHSPGNEEKAEGQDSNGEEKKEKLKSSSPSKVKEPEPPVPASSAPAKLDAHTGPTQASPSQPQSKTTQPAKTSQRPVAPETQQRTDLDLADKITTVELKSEIQSLKVLMEAMKAQYERDMSSITKELKEEKAKRLALQMEVEKVKKVVSL